MFPEQAAAPAVTSTYNSTLKVGSYPSSRRNFSLSSLADMQLQRECSTPVRSSSESYVPQAPVGTSIDTESSSNAGGKELREDLAIPLGYRPSEVHIPLGSTHCNHQELSFVHPNADPSFPLYLPVYGAEPTFLLPEGIRPRMPMYMGPPPPRHLIHHPVDECPSQALAPHYYESDGPAQRPSQFPFRSANSLSTKILTPHLPDHPHHHSPMNARGLSQSQRDFPMESSFQGLALHDVFGSGFGPAAGSRQLRRRDGRSSRRTQVPISPTQSPLLVEFRSPKGRSRTWQLKELFGHIVEFSYDQHGSRFLQESVEFATSEERQQLFAEIYPEHAPALMQDVFGNYVIQKLLQYGTPDQRAGLIDTVLSQAFTLSRHIYGCRVVQKAIECAPRKLQNAFIREIEPHLIESAKDCNGNHVIQKLVIHLSSSPDQLHFIRIFRGHVAELAAHMFGCRVLQRCLEHLPMEQTRGLLDELMASYRDLITNQYGNYVIQDAIKHGSNTDQYFAAKGLQGIVMSMARHKYASNVVEKAIAFCTPEMRGNLIDELITPQPGVFNPVQMMLLDQYANYVLRTATRYVEGAQKTVLKTLIRSVIHGNGNAKNKCLNVKNKTLKAFELFIDS